MAKTTKFNSNNQKPLILVSPLDWGLGHTTRCIPLIRELEARGCSVMIACNQRQQDLLQPEFPGLRFVELPGYDLHYGHSRGATIGRILLQLPKLYTRIRREQRWLQAFLAQNPVNAVIADNRFGLYTSQVPAIFITHQLAIKTGLGALADRLAQGLNYRFIRRFSACWVPDFRGDAALAGLLSNPVQLPAIPLRYLGSLSRFEACSNRTTEHDLLVLLSGPEPQRSIFEQLMLKELSHFSGKAVLVRGLPGGGHQQPVSSRPGLTVMDHVPAAALNELICRSAIVISRPGFTTVMDLLKLGSKCIGVPTPGQGEQEYLGRHLMQQGYLYTMPQQDFSLEAALEAARHFGFKKTGEGMEGYKVVLEQFIAELVQILNSKGPG